MYSLNPSCAGVCRDGYMKPVDFCFLCICTVCVLWDDFVTVLVLWPHATFIESHWVSSTFLWVAYNSCAHMHTNFPWPYWHMGLWDAGVSPCIPPTKLCLCGNDHMWDSYFMAGLILRYACGYLEYKTMLRKWWFHIATHSLDYLGQTHCHCYLVLSIYHSYLPSVNSTLMVA